MSFLTLNLCPLFAHSGRCLFSVICPIILRSGSIKLNLNQPLSEDLTLPVFGSEDERRKIIVGNAQKERNCCDLWIITKKARFWRDCAIKGKNINCRKVRVSVTTSPHH